MFQYTTRPLSSPWFKKYLVKSVHSGAGFLDAGLSTFCLPSVLTRVAQEPQKNHSLFRLVSKCLWLVAEQAIMYERLTISSSNYICQRAVYFVSLPLVYIFTFGTSILNTVTSSCHKLSANAIVN